MADVRPFRGVRFDPSRVNLDAVLCPPFDVISPAEQQAYHQRDPHNVIRLELGQGNPDPVAPDNWYAGAAATLQRWVADGTLIQEDTPALYLYEHSFTRGGRDWTRRGVLVAGRLHDWQDGVVLPHEDVRKGPIQSRLALLQAAHTNVSPLWLVYDDAGHAVAQVLEAAWAAEPAGVAHAADETHVLRVVRDAGTLRTVADAFAALRLYVADGHHRYHTAQLFRDEQRRRAQEAGQSPDPDAAYEFALMMLVPLDDPGMVLLPTHRLVRGLDAPLAEVRRRLSRWFTLTPLDLPADAQAAGSAIEQTLVEAGRDEHVFALVEAGGAWLLRLRVDSGWEQVLPAERSAAWRGLDVVVLDTLAIRDVCGIRAEAEAAHADATSHGAADRLTYVSDFADAVRAVRAGEAQQGYFLNPTRIEQVCAVADAGDRMPPTSTCFAPQPLTGLVMHCLDGRRTRPQIENGR